ncbi:hypothetical protein M378DRAFT_49908, partial [Amanita muscaria Koide BX008]
PKEFSATGLLEAVAQFVACEDQSLAVVNKKTFRNQLVIMRPKTMNNDLPSTHNVMTYIHNEFCSVLESMKAAI